MPKRTRSPPPAALVLLVPVLWAASASLTAAQTEPARPVIEVRQIPPAGGGPHRMEQISGTVENSDPTVHRIVIFSGTDRWYVQPFVTAPFTLIRQDGTWS